MLQEIVIPKMGQTVEEATIENFVLSNSLIGKQALVRGGYRRLNVGDSSQVDLSMDMGNGENPG